MLSRLPFSVEPHAKLRLVLFTVVNISGTYCLISSNPNIIWGLESRHSQQSYLNRVENGSGTDKLLAC